MKKAASILLVLILTVSLVACAASPATESVQKSTDDIIEEVMEAQIISDLAEGEKFVSFSVGSIEYYKDKTAATVEGTIFCLLDSESLFKRGIIGSVEFDGSNWKITSMSYDNIWERVNI